MDTVEKVRNLLEDLKKNFQCTICLELLAQPVSTKCNHQFCSGCLNEFLSIKKNAKPCCPLCKTKITKRGLHDSNKLGEIVSSVRDLCNAADDDCLALGKTPLLSQRQRRYVKKGQKSSDASKYKKSLSFLNESANRINVMKHTISIRGSMSTKDMNTNLSNKGINENTSCVKVDVNAKVISGNVTTSSALEKKGCMENGEDDVELQCNQKSCIKGKKNELGKEVAVEDETAVIENDRLRNKRRKKISKISEIPNNSKTDEETATAKDDKEIPEFIVNTKPCSERHKLHLRKKHKDCERLISAGNIKKKVKGKKLANKTISDEKENIFFDKSMDWMDIMPNDLKDKDQISFETKEFKEKLDTSIEKNSGKISDIVQTSMPLEGVISSPLTKPIVSSDSFCIKKLQSSDVEPLTLVSYNQDADMKDDSQDIPSYKQKVLDVKKEMVKESFQTKVNFQTKVPYEQEIADKNIEMEAAENTATTCNEIDFKGNKDKDSKIDDVDNNIETNQYCKQRSYDALNDSSLSNDVLPCPIEDITYTPQTKHKRKMILSILDEIESPNKDQNLFGNLSFAKCNIPKRFSVMQPKIKKSIDFVSRNRLTCAFENNEHIHEQSEKYTEKDIAWKDKSLTVSCLHTGSPSLENPSVDAQDSSSSLNSKVSSCRRKKKKKRTNSKDKNNIGLKSKETLDIEEVFHDCENNIVLHKTISHSETEIDNCNTIFETPLIKAEEKSKQCIQKEDNTRIDETVLKTFLNESLSNKSQKCVANSEELIPPTPPQNSNQFLKSYVQSCNNTSKEKSINCKSSSKNRDSSFSVNNGSSGNKELIGGNNENYLEHKERIGTDKQDDLLHSKINECKSNSILSLKTKKNLFDSLNNDIVERETPTKEVLIKNHDNLKPVSENPFFCANAKEKFEVDEKGISDLIDEKAPISPLEDYGNVFSESIILSSNTAKMNQEVQNVKNGKSSSVAFDASEDNDIEEIMCVNLPDKRSIQNTVNERLKEEIKHNKSLLNCSFEESAKECCNDDSKPSLDDKPNVLCNVKDEGNNNSDIESRLPYVVSINSNKTEELSKKFRMSLKSMIDQGVSDDENFSEEVDFDMVKESSSTKNSSTNTIKRKLSLDMENEEISKNLNKKVKVVKNDNFDESFIGDIISDTLRDVSVTNTNNFMNNSDNTGVRGNKNENVNDNIDHHTDEEEEIGDILNEEIVLSIEQKCDNPIEKLIDVKEAGNISNNANSPRTGSKDINLIEKVGTEGEIKVNNITDKEVLMNNTSRRNLDKSIMNNKDICINEEETSEEEEAPPLKIKNISKSIYEHYNPNQFPDAEFRQKNNKSSKVISATKLKRKKEREKLVQQLQRFVNDLSKDDSDDSSSGDELLAQVTVTARNVYDSKRRKSEKLDGQEQKNNLSKEDEISKKDEVDSTTINYSPDKRTTPISGKVSRSTNVLLPKTPLNWQPIPVAHSTFVREQEEVFKKPQTTPIGIKVLQKSLHRTPEVSNIGSLATTSSVIQSKLFEGSSNSSTENLSKNMETPNGEKIIIKSEYKTPENIGKRFSQPTPSTVQSIKVNSSDKVLTEQFPSKIARDVSYQSPHTTTGTPNAKDINKDLLLKSPLVMMSRLNRQKLIYCVSALKKLNGKYCQAPSDKATHLLVATDENRCLSKESYTFKYLIAIVCGMWILDIKWLQECIKSNKFVDEEPFEVKGDPTDQHEDIPKRYRKIVFRNKEVNLFTGYRMLLHGTFQQSQIKKDQLSLLLEKTGSELATSIEDVYCSSSQIETKVVTDNLHELSKDEKELILANGLQCIHPEWIVESLISLKVQDTRRYAMKFTET